MKITAFLGILVFIVSAAGMRADDYSIPGGRSPVPNQPGTDKLVQIIPGQLVDPLPGQIVQPLPGQLVPLLPGQLAAPLPGQIVHDPLHQPLLPGQLVRSLPGQLIHSLPGRVNQKTRQEAAALAKHKS